MTTTHRTRESGAPAATAMYISTFFKRYWRVHQERRKHQKLRAILYGLPDRDLKDMGITRSEIEYLALNSSNEHIDARRHR